MILNLINSQTYLTEPRIGNHNSLGAVCKFWVVENANYTAIQIQQLTVQHLNLRFRT